MERPTFQDVCAGCVAVLSVAGAIGLAAFGIAIPDMLVATSAAGTAYLFGRVDGYTNGYKNGQKIVQLSRRRKAA